MTEPILNETEPRDYYVSVRDAGRHGYLLGPYDTHQEALDNVPRGRELAFAAHPCAVFYAFGTLSLPAGTQVAAVFGK